MNIEGYTGKVMDFKTRIHKKLEDTKKALISLFEGYIEKVTSYTKEIDNDIEYQLYQKKINETKIKSAEDHFNFT